MPPRYHRNLAAFVFYLFQQRSLLRRAPPPAARDQLWLLSWLEPLSTRITDQQLVEELGKLPLMFQPGTSWEYGRSIDVLLALVEKVSGQRADRFFQERIFQPLGMTDTFFNVPPDKLDRVAQPGPDPDTHETAKLTNVTKFDLRPSRQ